MGKLISKRSGFSIVASISHRVVGSLCGALIMAVLFSGCGPKGPSFFQIENTIPALLPTHGRLYFLNTSGKQARLAIDKESIGKINSSSFFWEDLPAGRKVITADTWGDFGAWNQSVDVVAGQDHYIRIKNRRAASIALGLFGVVGQIAEAASATEGQSGPFEIEVVDVITGKEERAKLVFSRESSPNQGHERALPKVPPPSASEVEVNKTTSPRAVVSQRATSKKEIEKQGNCSVEQILSMKSSGLLDTQIKAACK